MYHRSYNIQSKCFSTFVDKILNKYQEQITNPNKIQIFNIKIYTN